MKARKLIILEVEKEERCYRLELPESSPLGEAYEVALQFMNEISRLLNEQVEKTNANFVKEQEKVLKKEETKKSNE